MTGRILFFSALVFILMGVAYVKGYDIVKRRSPEHLVYFYQVMAIIRMLLVVTMVALCALFVSTRADVIRDVAIILIMYVLTMVVTHTLRH